MPEVTLARHVEIRNHANLSVINIHNRKLRNLSLRPQPRIVKRPDRFVDRAVGEGIGVWVEIRHERDEPVFHVGCDGGVVDI